MAGLSDEALGMVLVVAAGLATALGAGVVFSPRLVALASPHSLSLALAGSAGVMVYVSLVEIFQKSVGAFAAADTHHTTDLLVWDNATQAWLEFDGGESPGPNAVFANLTRTVEGSLTGPPYLYATLSLFAGVLLTVLLGSAVAWLSPAAHQLQHNVAPKKRARASMVSVELEEGAVPVERRVELHADEGGVASATLGRTGLMTALAIALHNFPEGLATYVATVADPSVGAALAVAIAMHNIPEGVAVAVPVYFATHSRRSAFLWGTLSGLSEPIGGLIGYAALHGDVDQRVYGMLFGLVAGMMIFISVHELLPEALRHDPHDRFVTLAFVLGMAMMALSLCLFVAA